MNRQLPDTLQDGGKPIPAARFGIGEVVRHRLFDFRGVIFDVDPEFANSEEWYEAIPEEIRPPRDQPFYHLLAENTESSYIAYVSQQNLVPDEDAEEIDHPAIDGLFDRFAGGRYRLRKVHRH
jgi:heat shock protein HspQ